ncbi:MAG TPA: hypothetical protein P5079_04150 [Elusimicrobiota bacterium]|nr:hypothetical protein [Elusimicrobiota bacterium]
MRRFLKSAVGPLENSRGSVVVLIVMLIALLSFIPIGAELVKVARKNIKLQTNATVQADNVARAGLTDAVAWFKRQTSQPVGSVKYGMSYPDAAFYPRTSTNSVTSDTIDESIGLVKEYRIGESNWLWARYEARRQPDPSSNSIDPHAVHDITDKRVDGFAAGDGLAWYIESVGYVYRLRNSTVAFNVAPNEIVARSRVATEIRRLSLTVPAAAVRITSRANGTVNANCRVSGGNNAAGAMYTSGTGGSWSAGTRTTGTPALQSTTTAISVQSVFGVTDYDLKLMADYNVTSVNALPASYPSMALVYINGAATFNSSRPLRGGGVLIVNGNLTLDSGSNTLFSGLLWVNGNLTVNGPAIISGTAVVTGSLTMNGTVDVAEIQYDSGILSSVRQQVGQYRENKSAFHVFSAQK